MFATWNGRNPLTIYFNGSGAEFVKFVDRLVDDFNAPRENDEIDEDYQRSSEED